MKNIILLFVFSISFLNISFCQLANGSPAPDITVQDINGNTISLHASMAGGKSACLDIMATWCGPCWSFHNSGVLESVHANLSSLTNVYMLEGDFATNTNCLYGPSGCTGSGTWGNWVAGTPYQIANLTASNGGSVMNDYNINYFPTLYVISPDFRTWEIENRSYSEYYNWIVHSFTLDATGSVNHSTCGDNGKVNLNPTGGYGVLKFKWSNGATTEDLINIPGGVYSVTVTDQNGYFESYGPWTVDGPAKRVAITSQKQTNNICFGESKGDITIQVAYGTPSYTYSWSNGATSNLISGLPAGLYTVTVTDAANCTITKTYSISEPPLLTAIPVKGDESCDSKNGFIAITASGGTKPYSYDIGFGKRTTSVFNNLSGGTYNIKVTDSKNCLFTDQITVDATHKPVTEAGANTNIYCGRDTVFLDGFGTDQGSDFTYTWTTRKGKILGDHNTLQIALDKPGVYVLKVKNLINGCENSDSVEVKDIRVYPDVKATGDGLVDCNTPDRTLSGTTLSTHTKYFWTKLNGGFKDTSKTILVSAGGDFVFNVQDTVNQCLSKDTVVIKEDKVYPQIQIETNGNLNCTVRNLDIDALNSDFGNNFEIDWITNDGHIVSGADGLQPLVDKPGTYVLEIKNKTNGCLSVESVSIAEDVTKPSIVLAQIKDVSCIHPEIVLDASASLPAGKLEYQWTTSDGHIVSGNQYQQLTVNKGGSYDLVLRNKENTCTNFEQFKVLEQSTPVSAFNYNRDLLTLNFRDESKGIAKSWAWDFGDQTTSSEQNPTHQYAKEGEYKVCLKIENECGVAESCQNIVLASSSILSLGAWEIRNVSCYGGNDGFIKLTVQGGTPPYSYVWSDGSTSSELKNISKGNYSVEVKDALGAIIQKSFSVGQATDILYGNLSIAGATDGLPNGSISLEVSGGVPSYQFLWSNGMTTEHIQGLALGSYSLRVKDANGCEKSFGPFEVRDVTATNDVSGLESFEILPNPVQEHGRIFLTFDQKTSFSLSLSDAMGRTVHEWKLNSNQADISLDLSSLDQGLYLVVLKTNKGLLTKKWMVLK
ncbi:MAG: T9SS type A sorting domain-containing protein [Saprospiraceae bacterium]|nr:T9SS type A sorting domain-containing protein [Candidatus Vicinibacter affinis]